MLEYLPTLVYLVGQQMELGQWNEAAKTLGCHKSQHESYHHGILICPSPGDVAIELADMTLPPKYTMSRVITGCIHLKTFTKQFTNVDHRCNNLHSQV